MLNPSPLQVRQMLVGGQSPDTADYDTRTGLMLACHEGHEAVVRMLLTGGADPMVKVRAVAACCLCVFSCLHLSVM